jgi:hypothetical protein
MSKKLCVVMALAVVAVQGFAYGGGYSGYMYDAAGCNRNESGAELMYRIQVDQAALRAQREIAWEAMRLRHAIENAEADRRLREAGR